MKQHFTRNTVEASAWCLKCGKQTMHRVDRDDMQGRLGPCLVCMAKHDEQKEAPLIPVEKQGDLF